MNPSVLNLSSEINSFYQRTRPQQEHVTQQDTLITYIDECVDYLYYECVAKMNEDDAFLDNMRRNQTSESGWNIFKFGSSSYGTYGLHSDIDLAINLNFRNNRFDKILILKELSQLISQNDEYGLLRIQLLLTAKYPIIRLYHQTHPIKIDISIADCFCFKRNQFISDLITHYHEKYNLPMQKLIIFIKYWSKQRGINNSYKCYLNSFGFTLLIIQFIQYLLQRNKALMHYNKSVANLLFEWFEFYCFKFDLLKYAVDITPHPIFRIQPKNPFCAMEIMDPVNPVNNVAINVGGIQLHHMMAEFMRAFHILRQWMDTEASHAAYISLFAILTQTAQVQEVDMQSNISSISNSTMISDIIPINLNHDENVQEIMMMHMKKNKDEDEEKESIEDMFGRIKIKYGKDY